MEKQFNIIDSKTKFVFRKMEDDPKELMIKARLGEIEIYNEEEIMEVLKRKQEHDKLEKFMSAVSYYSIHSWFGGLNGDLYGIGIIAL